MLLQYKRDKALDLCSGEPMSTDSILMGTLFTALCLLLSDATTNCLSFLHGVKARVIKLPDTLGRSAV